MQIDACACRMSRAALNWSQARLAHEARVGLQTVLKFENGSSVPRRNNLRELVLALERGGILFLMHDGRFLVVPPLPVPTAIVAD